MSKMLPQLRDVVAEWSFTPAQADSAPVLALVIALAEHLGISIDEANRNTKLVKAVREAYKEWSREHTTYPKDGPDLLRMWEQCGVLNVVIPVAEESEPKKPRKKKEVLPVDGFTGFQFDNDFTRLPNKLIERLSEIDSLAELKVILYIARHTVGFYEEEKPKRITLDEFMNGRKKKNGTRLDAGTGLSREVVVAGLNAAETHGFIIVGKDDHDLARKKRSYRLALTTDFVPNSVENEGQESEKPTSEHEKPTSESMKSRPRTEKETSERNQGRYSSPYPPHGGFAKSKNATESVAFSDVRGELPASLNSQKPEEDADPSRHDEPVQKINDPRNAQGRTEDSEVHEGRASSATVWMDGIPF